MQPSPTWNYETLRNANGKVCRTKEYTYFFLKRYQEEGFIPIPDQWHFSPCLSVPLSTEEAIIFLNDWEAKLVEYDEIWLLVELYCRLYSRHEPIRYGLSPAQEREPYGLCWEDRDYWIGVSDVHYAFRQITMLLEYKDIPKKKMLSHFDARVLAFYLRSQLVSSSKEEIFMKITGFGEVKIISQGDVVKIVWQYIPAEKHLRLMKKIRAPLSGHFSVALSYGTYPHFWGRDDEELAEIIRQVIWQRWKSINVCIDRLTRHLTQELIERYFEEP